MNEARRVQLEVLRRMTPAERLRRGMELTRLACQARDARLRAQNPGVTEKELQRIRLREVLSLARPVRLPPVE